MNSLQQNNVPTVSTVTFLRNAPQILKNPLPFHNANFTRLGDTFRLKIGAKKSLLFSRNANFAQYVLQKNQKNYQKSEIQTKDIAKYIGKGLLTINGEHWKKQRKLIQPAFHKKQLVGLLEAVQQAIADEIAKITTNQPIDVFPIMNDLAFQTVVKALFSGAASKQDVERLQYITETAQRKLVEELRQPYKQWWFKLTGKIKRNLSLTQKARVILKRIVNERKQQATKQNDLLDMLLDARYDDGTPMEESQLIDEILVLFIAGHETTSNALTFFCELMARHPEVQEIIADEIRGTNTPDLMLQIQQRTYTTAVINEVMRLYPPAYFIDRVSIEDDVFNGVHIPKGTSVLLSVYEIHRNTAFWDNPETFNPDRFLDISTQSTLPYYPFGAGPRKCIGNNFAMFEMVLAVSQIVSKFTIAKKTTPIEILPLITLKPKNAVLQFTARN